MIDYKKNLCSRCVSPHTAESINFDDKEVCSVCHQIDFKEKNRLIN